MESVNYSTALNLVQWSYEWLMSLWFGELTELLRDFIIGFYIHENDFMVDWNT